MNTYSFKPRALCAALSISAALTISPVLLASSHDHPHDHAHPIAQSHRHSHANAEHAVTQASTEALIKAKNNWKKAQGKAAKSTALQALIEQAQSRRTLMAELIQHNPAKALALAIPNEKQSELPSEVQEQLEQIVTVQGELELFYEDYEDGSHQLRRYLNTPAGERFALNQAGKPKQHLTGELVEVKGVLLNNLTDINDHDGLLAAESGDAGILTLAAGGDTSGSSNGGTPDPVANTFGEQKTAVFLINFQDAPDDQPFTVAETQASVFTDVDDFIRENSFGQTWLTGDVFGWYTAPVNSTTCDTAAIQSSAMAQAESRGNDLSQYNRLIFIHPYTSACKWSGVGSVGGSPSTSTINGSLPYSTIAHEFGHNLGLYHSHAQECGSASTGENCSSIEYGNIPDIMGTMVAGHFNAFQKERLGWLGFGSSPSITTVSTPGSYTINPYSADTNDTKALKVYNGIDPATGNQTWYYLEYRQPIGFDSGLSIAGNYLEGVTVTSGSPSDGNSSFILDMTPNTSDWWDGALEPGFEFYDPYSGNSILTETTTSNGATVYVNPVAAGTCTQAVPGLIADPSLTQWLSAGDTVSYTLTVSNQDTVACDSSTIQLSASVPSGWSKAFSNSSVTLSPGESTNVVLQVTSPSTAAETFYGLNMTAAKEADTTSVSRMVMIDNSVVNENTAPVAANDSASTNEGSAVTIHVLANDSDADGDALSVTGTSGVNGSAVVNSNGTITFTPAAGFSGSETFNYSISDGQGGSDTASVTVSVSSVNHAPVASNDSASTNEESAVTINVLANDSDADGDTLSVTGTSGVNGSAVVNSNGTITFTPAAGFSGSETFNYSISDGQGGSDSASVTVTVSAVNHAPVASNDSASTNQDSAVTISVLANDSDADGDTLSVTGTSGVNGTAVVNANGTITFTPAAGFSGSETFNYAVSDGQGGTDSAAVTVTVNAVSTNTAPVAVSDTANMSSKSAITIPVLVNDYDAENDTLTVEAVSQGAKGSVWINGDGTLTYTPARSFKRSDSFSYTISDGDKTATATVSVQLSSDDGGDGGTGGKGNGKKK
ncbi:Ig-like domain-containing protein [uncultured Neptuniibacter sp.]|uniref:Ig-like domain-containing protein n=1 Tax=uncultured Neptuniibacter sp. TaxID=502143 RepID=UPI00261AC337|nr:Ig-like domain-containing protein [uncultured Neptuniibacter sp.]